ncbi:MAG: MFS transporter [Dehalococcoidia bacterium]
MASGALALFSALESPARQAIVPNLVPREELTRAIAVNSIQRDAGAIVGPALAGILIAVSGSAACYAIDALSWLTMLGCLLLIAGAAIGVLRPNAGNWVALREGLGFVWTHPVLSLMALDFGATGLGAASFDASSDVFQHDLGRLDDYHDRLPLAQVQPVHAARRDDGGHLLARDINDHL